MNKQHGHVFAGKLVYIKKATKAQDGADGLLYFHQWHTGNQELIFDDEEDAEKFAKAEDLAIYHKRK